MSKSRFAKYKPSSQNPVAGGLFVALFAAIGVYLLIGSHAASPTITTSASNGTVGCNASIQSGYVKFGAGNGTSCGGGGSGPGLGGGANMLVGVNEGTGHGTTGAQEAAAVGGYDRLDATGGNTSSIASAIQTFAANHVRVDLLIGSGSASNWVTFYKNVCTGNGLPANECPTVEIENEPDLNGVSYQTYAGTLKADYLAFHNTLGSSSPVVVGAFEGGSTSSFSFGDGWINYNPDTGQSSSGYMKNYVDAVYTHPYGHHISTGICNSSYKSYLASAAAAACDVSGSATNSVIASALGDRPAVARVHSDSGKPVIITEVGWPTDTSSSTPVSNQPPATGDSDQWPKINCNNNPTASPVSNGNYTNSCSGGGPNQGDQCNNVYNFITWARTTGYIYGVVYFGINDYGSSQTFYGILDGSGNKKPSFGALAAVAFNKPNPCPNPLTY